MSLPEDFYRTHAGKTDGVLYEAHPNDCLPGTLTAARNEIKRRNFKPARVTQLETRPKTIRVQELRIANEPLETFKTPKLRVTRPSLDFGFLTLCGGNINMNVKRITLSAIALCVCAASMMLTSCSSNNNSSSGSRIDIGPAPSPSPSPSPSPQLTQVGYFIDGPVEGLTYTCKKGGVNGYEGITNKDGRFTCDDGDDTIVFNVGNIRLPEIPITRIIYPLSYYPDKEFNDPEVLRFVQFIMSAGTVDSDGNIKIDANPFGGRYGVYSDNLFYTLNNEGLIGVDRNAAEAHLESSLLQAYSGTYSGTYTDYYNDTSCYFYFPDYGCLYNGIWTVHADGKGGITGSWYNEIDFEVGGIEGSYSANGIMDVDMLESGGYSSDGNQWYAELDLATGKVAGELWGNREGLLNYSVKIADIYGQLDE